MTVEELIAKKKRLKISVRELSAISGVPVGTINKILSGETKKPRTDTMDALEKALIQQDRLCEKKMNYGSKYPRQGSYTLEDLEKMTDSNLIELIDGVIYDMGAPTVEHQTIAWEFANQVLSYIRANKGNCFPTMASAVFPTDDNRTMLIPDFSITCDDEKVGKRGIHGAPDFVMEILSPSTAKKDKTLKFAKYHEAGVREYWLIDPMKKTMIAYKFFGDMVTRIHPLEGELGLAIYDDRLMIDLDAIAAIIDQFEQKEETDEGGDEV